MFLNSLRVSPLSQEERVYYLLTYPVLTWLEAPALLEISLLSDQDQASYQAKTSQLSQQPLEDQKIQVAQAAVTYGNYRYAQACLRQVAKDKWSPLAYEVRARIHLALGQYAKAGAIYSHLGQDYKKTLCDIYLDRPGLEDDLLLALEASPEEDLYRLLGMYYYRQGRDEDALTSFGQVKQALTREEEKRLARLWVRTGQPAPAPLPPSLYLEALVKEKAFQRAWEYFLDMDLDILPEPVKLLLVECHLGLENYINAMDWFNQVRFSQLTLLQKKQGTYYQALLYKHLGQHQECQQLMAGQLDYMKGIYPVEEEIK